MFGMVPHRALLRVLAFVFLILILACLFDTPYDNKTDKT